MTQTTTLIKLHQNINSLIQECFSLNSWQLKYQADLYPLFTVLSIALIQFSLFFFCQQLNILVIVSLVLLFPQLMLSTMVHNQAHVAMFRGKIPNWIVNIGFFLATGMRVVQFQIQHNFGHHCFYLDSDRNKDPANTIQADGSIMSRWKFMIQDIFLYIPDTIRIGKFYPHLLNKWYLELGICLKIVIILLMVHPLRAMILFLIPILLIRRFFMLIVYEDHIHLSIDDSYAASHTKTNHLINILFFNNGYHLAHHLKPSLHWSKLPEFHQQIESKITVPSSQTLLNKIFE